MGSGDWRTWNTQPRSFKFVTWYTERGMYDPAMPPKEADYGTNNNDNNQGDLTQVDL